MHGGYYPDSNIRIVMALTLRSFTYGYAFSVISDTFQGQPGFFKTLISLRLLWFAPLAERFIFWAEIPFSPVALSANVVFIVLLPEPII
ncbi:hypothetical protein BDR04DRAFT_12611 [Suillus decipiens]|nr:hypothetical protein BDR04DRAFT_12611 [Suillus decipiens]